MSNGETSNRTAIVVIAILAAWSVVVTGTAVLVSKEAAGLAAFFGGIIAVVATAFTLKNT